MPIKPSSRDLYGKLCLLSQPSSRDLYYLLWEVMSSQPSSRDLYYLLWVSYVFSAQQ